jgi:hypothetical protein
MKIIQKTSTVNTTYKNNRKIEYIVVHYTAGTRSKKGAAENTAAYFMSGNAGGSADFIVDDDSIVQYNPDIKNRYCWSVGGGKYTKMTTAEGGKFFGVCTNVNSISVEMCSCKKNTNNLNGNAEDWYFTDCVINNTIELISYLLKQYHISVNNVIMHHSVTGKVCLPIDSTELLTKDGWKKFSDLKVGEPVVSYDNKKNVLRLSPVIDIVVPYESETLKNRCLEATKDHRMYVVPNASNSHKYRDVEWNYILTGKKSYIIKTAAYFKEYEGLDISDDELRFLVWVQGDGHYMKSTTTGNIRGLDFHFKKKRKIERFVSLLEDLGIVYKLTIQKDGSTRIKINNPDIWRQCEKYLCDKKFTYQFINMTPHQYEIFFNELVLVDGNVTKRSYCSAIESNLDVVQAIHCTHNQRSNICQTGTLRAVLAVNSNYTLGLLKGENREERKTLVSCVNVKEGYILIRQNGRTFIVGNCPNPWCVNSSRLSEWERFKEKLRTYIGEDIDMGELNKLEERVSAFEERVKELESGREKIYATIEDVPEWGKPTVQKLLAKGILNGTGASLDITYTLLRLLVINDRAGVYDTI